MASAPTPARVAGCGLAVAAFAAGIWWLVEVRSAPPPPPVVTMPDRAPAGAFVSPH